MKQRKGQHQPNQPSSKGRSPPNEENKYDRQKTTTKKDKKKKNSSMIGEQPVKRGKTMIESNLDMRMVD